LQEQKSKLVNLSDIQAQQQKDLASTPGDGLLFGAGGDDVSP